MRGPLDQHRYFGVNWKQDLRLSRTELDRHLAVDGSVLVAVERFAMRAALAFRKLLVHQVLSNEVRDAAWPARRYPCTSRPDPRLWFDGTVDLVSYHHFVRHYDLERPRDARMDLKTLSDRLLHSLVFVVWPRSDDALGDTRFFFNSDWNQDAVWEMTVGELMAIVDEVLYDEIVFVKHNKYQKNPDRQEQHNRAWVAARGTDRFND